MIVKIKAGNLQVGMFVDLSESWVENPFWKNQFEITSMDQVQLIIDSGIKVVSVDTAKSKPHIKGLKDLSIDTQTTHNRQNGSAGMKSTDTPAAYQNSSVTALEKTKPDIKQGDVDKGEKNKNNAGKEPHPPAKWAPEKFMPLELVQALDDKGLKPQIRAKVVYLYSIEIMKNLLKNPTAGVVGASKTGIFKTINIILSEHKTSSNLVKIVSHDFHIYTHSVNVGIKSILLSKQLYRNSEAHDIYELGAGFLLHDIGKVSISPDIINKHGKLTQEEFQIMKTHPYNGYKILSQLNQLSTEVWIIAMQHHERENGKGYPCKLKSNEIHPYARICCISDVYDALTASRPYRAQKTPMQALTIMKDEMLSHFNKDIFGKFLLLFKQ